VLKPDAVGKGIGMKANRNAYGAFALAARLAGQAIDAATELVETCQYSHEAEETLLFWHRMRDFNGTAALMCIGATQNRSEEIVARCLRGEKTGRSRNA
jgi:hypothetical protein